MEKSKEGIKLDFDDLHFMRFGKRFDEVKYYDEYECPICHSRVDEFGYCTCDATNG